LKNKNIWKPTKFEKYKACYRASRDIKNVGLGYRFITDIHAEKYFQLISKYATGKLLDLGCGDVALYEMYRPLVSDSICVDWGGTFHDVSFLDYEFNLNEPFPIEDDYFDTILLTDVLEHISNPDNVWKEMTRVLKPEGKIIIGVPFIHLIHEAPYDYFRYTEFMLKMYCDENSLKISELYPYGGALEIIIDILAKLFSFSRIISLIHYHLSRFITKTFIARKVFNITSHRYPLGYCLVAVKASK
jgi:SAM-dependent methyltransferase